MFALASSLGIRREQQWPGLEVRRLLNEREAMAARGMAILAMTVPGRGARATITGRENDEGCNDFIFPLLHEGGAWAVRKMLIAPGMGFVPGR